MKILYVSPYYYPASKFGGPISAVHALNKVLVKKGHNVEVYTTSAGLNEQGDVPLGKSIEIEGVKVTYFKQYGDDHIAFAPKLFLELPKHAREFDILSLSEVWPLTVLAGSVAGSLWGLPYVISPHGTLTGYAMNLKSKTKKFSYYHLIAKHYLKKAQAITFSSEYEKNASLYPQKQKTFVIPNGIDLSAFGNLPKRGLFRQRHPALKNKRVVLFLGRLAPIKGLDVLAKAFGELIRNRDDVFLVIAGPDYAGYETRVRAWLRDEGLSEKTLFTGLLSFQEKLSAYVDADVFVMPSYLESFGISAVEAMACGTPTIVSENVGISNEIRQHNAGVVVETTTESLSNGMMLLLEDTHQAAEMVSNAQELVKNRFEINAVADTTVNAYEEILKSYHGKELNK